ncbi:PstS family phosphate ABC transporter substrate-binding protein [Desulfonatronum lacustre]|uniref:PstS family phosphate ABC transporter substrate-binding protein n=1 Tax=Desulfonatronum lacustre TaxID=66849 RepID=UPI0004BA07B3|nr:phosphate ABC transporter substrate-binding protein PstS family protein [Desulfonatronum lacustre]SMP46562.1 phosphate ABC transporter substrate-binding protein, PhoT family [Desulfonatronum zhilinae]
MRKILATIMLFGMLTAGNVSAQTGVDPALPEYTPVSGISGNLSSMGSDTLNNLMTLWAEAFQGYYPNVNIQIQGAGSSTAPPALIEATANFGPMSREMRATEIEQFEQRYGYQPVKVTTAVDTIAVYLNKDNPLDCLSIPEIDAIFSATRRCGHGEDVTRWGQVGLTGAWANRDFTIYSRNAVSGTYGFFKDVALCGGDYKPTINEQPGSASVVQGVTESINGIGYSGIGYITSGVKAASINMGGTCYEPNAENAASGNYPLARGLFLYVNKNPTEPLAPVEREFLRLVLSKQGQEVVVRDGYIPLPETVAAQVRAQIGL